MSRRTLLAGTMLAWVTFVLTGYYIVHKPLTPQTSSALALALGHWLLAASLVALAGGVGRRFLPFQDSPPLLAAVVQAALGLGLFGLLWLGIGTVGGFRRGIFWGVWALGWLLLWRDIFRWLAAWQTLGGLIATAGRWGYLVALLVGLMLVASALNALAPPLKFDALTYHLVLPWHYLHTGRFASVPGSLLWGMPQQEEMLATWALGLGGAATATALGWWVAVLVLAGVLALGAEWVSSRAGWAAIAVLMAGFTWWDSAAWGYADQWAALFGLAALPLLARWRRAEAQKRLPWALWSGALAGFAAGAKYTAALLPFLGFLWLGWETLHLQESKRWRSLLAFSGAVGVVFFPWLLKNLLATATPFFPFGLHLTAADANRLYPPREHQPWYAIAFLPLTATFFGKEGAVGFSASIGAWLLALAPGAFLARIKSHQREHRLTAWLTVGGIIVWAAATLFNAHAGQTRLYFVLFPAFALLAAWGFENMWGLRLGNIRVGATVQALLALTLLLATAQAGFTTLQREAPSAVLGIWPREKYLDHNLGWYAPAMRTIRALPPGERVLLLWEPRSFYCLPRCVPDEVIDRFWHDRRQYGTASAIIAAWQARGFTEILFYRGGANFIRQQSDAYYTPDDWETLQEVLNRLHPVQNFGDAYILYRLSAPESTP